MLILQTARLRLREFEPADAAFALRLLNEPSFIANIADRGVRTLDGALKYLQEGPRASYARHGFGLWLAELSDTGEPAGMCGLLRRDTLDDVDIGYAFVPEHWGRGLAREAAQATLDHARDHLGLPRVVAIVNPDNQRSIHLLEQLAFRDEGLVRLAADAEPLKLFLLNL